MGRNKEIIIDLDENGDCTVSGENFIGPECDKFIKEINNCLGTETSAQKKREYRETQINRSRNLERNK